jgi:S-adenosylmethionine:tRNA ribosyltransferase-isomerase
MPGAVRDRLRQADLVLPIDLIPYLQRHGEPIRYGYVSAGWRLADYQTVFASVPGSSEMPSAGRPFSQALCDRLAARGVRTASITLHTGVASLERGELPTPEPFIVSAITAATLNDARARGAAIIAIGTSVVRALHTCQAENGQFIAGEGFTDVVVRPTDSVPSIDGLVTGWHEPEASHLLMLSAIMGSARLRATYMVAATRNYLWHEFGDSLLILRRHTISSSV